MADYNVQLKGWHALLAITALVGFTGFKMYLRVVPWKTACGMQSASTC
jgi:hypothetical protein